MGKTVNPPTLQRNLKNRHIQLIALGGAVGTGLFYGITPVIHRAGPSILLGYLIAGCIAYLIMRQLSEMVVAEPVAGSFSHFADKYWGRFAGYFAGWNYWLLYILVGMSELTACGKAINTLWPEIPNWQTVLIAFMMINLINLSAVKYYGEIEFCFSIIKVITIIGIILWGIYLLISGTGGPQASISNLWRYGGFFPNGVSALVMSMAVIMFSFGGLELLGITAAEAHQPEKSIPKATNQILLRIILFYIGSISILLCLYPWTSINPQQEESPFVQMFSMLDQHTLAIILNVIILSIVLSAYNSDAYCTGRMLYGMAKQGNAPKALLHINKKGVPQRAILFSALITMICVVINYKMTNALTFLMALVVGAMILNWVLITLTHFKFRQAMDKKGMLSQFPALFYPLGNYLSLLFLIGILVIMAMSWGTDSEGNKVFSIYQYAVIGIPIWLITLTLCYRFSIKRH